MRSLLVICVLAGAAHADEPAPKSEKTAQILSGVGVGVSGALILAGFAFTDSVFPYNRPLMYAGLGTALVTPSLGEFYAGEYLTIGMAVRAVGVGLAVYGLTHYTEDVLCQAEDTGKTGCKSLKAGAIPFLGLAAIAFVGGMAYDVSDAGEAVQRWNARHGFTITPTVVPTTTGPAPGISLVGQF